MNFFQKLNTAISQNQSLLVIGLDPNPEMMPPSKGELIASLEQWLQFIISETAPFVCAYKPSLGFYEALGADGLELLQQIFKAIPDNIPVILDAKHGDINTSSIFARTIFENWQVDAVTLNPYSGQDHIAPFLVYPDNGAFILCHTSNQGAINLQEFPNCDNPFYLQVVKEMQTWGTPEQVFLEVGTTKPEILKRIRDIAPERLILLRSLWEDKSKFQELISVGLSSSNDGLLIPVPQDFLSKSDLAARVKSLRDEVNLIRENRSQDRFTDTTWIANVCLLNQHPHQDLILQLFDIGCLMFGDYVQASGETFSYYVDLRRIISNPKVFQQVIEAYGEILRTLTFDRIAGIPYGSLPTATGLSLLLNHPMIFPRKEVKAHGTRRLIEGNFQTGETIVVVDDILISGKSAIEGAEKIKSAGLLVNDIVVFIDHGGGVKDKLRSHGYQAYSVLNLSEITDTLYEAGRITEEQYSCFLDRSH
jgi:uridine monophosphate synthetase